VRSCGVGLVYLGTACTPVLPVGIIIMHIAMHRIASALAGRI